MHPGVPSAAAALGAPSPAGLRRSSLTYARYGAAMLADVLAGESPAGGTLPVADERTTVAGVRDLLEAACELTPHARTAAFAGARAGLRPGTPDDLPIIGPSQAVPNLMYATGHYRNGVLLAPLTAQLVADALLDHRIDSALAAVSPSRFGDL